MAQSHARPAQSVDEVVERMRAIGARLDPGDGIACFNRMHLRIAALVERRIAAGEVRDPAFVERLGVLLANQYFDVLDAAEEGREVGDAWQPLVDARDDRRVWPVQFAFAGTNAHLCHDLPLAVVETCIERRTTPDTPPVQEDYVLVGELLVRAEAEERAGFEQRIAGVAAGAAEPLRHLVGAFSTARAREAAWAATLSLWHQRNIRPLFDATLAAVTAGTALAGRMLVTPVPVTAPEPVPESGPVPQPGPASESGPAPGSSGAE
ncbi:DUF5995 family protein [Kitasatospora purpeofusca]|uniref:DUF5995 family protein n=1 Tax=Kitasatospora purpeofusca TaxID=67352 RepID=UPI0006895BFF|nr:DUF5995 family protein [Kitasatospora purpeofusca]